MTCHFMLVAFETHIVQRRDGNIQYCIQHWPATQLNNETRTVRDYRCGTVTDRFPTTVKPEPNRHKREEKRTLFERNEAERF
jgi:hypothetical protein